jgi:two-component system CheB/CheR fusion protein
MRGYTDAALRVLVVDDNIDTASMLALMLRSWGHEAAVTYDGPSALARAVDFLPDAVLLDIGLPLLDGFEVATRLRSMPGLEGTLIVASSGYNREADLRRAADVGIDHYLVKPFDPLRLEQTLASCRPKRRAIPA